MRIDLTDTTSSRINAGLIEARRAIGTPAVGMVLTLVIVTDEGSAYDALKAASDASREHPSRILAVIKRPGRSPRDRAMARLDAEVLVGSDSGTGETVVLRMHGELANHAESVVLPLLLPDAPVVVWWPEESPDKPAEDPLGRLAQRRITDAAAAEDPVLALGERAEAYAPGDTDLAWTRITPWRSMLAAALDQKHSRIVSATVEGEAYNPSTELLALWLADRLKVSVERKVSDGPGITGVQLVTADGEIRLDRADGLLAELAMPGQPDRHVALKRRETSELIAEELRRLDPDDIYRSTVKFGVGRLTDSGPKDSEEPVEAIEVITPAKGAKQAGTAAAKSAAKAPAKKTVPAKKAATGKGTSS
ncbi:MULTISPECIES: glucose-6-phosphate dehydrogenase assembly protein OpcA [unclassified Streptomyces]|uniref:glucose-6-phosphate dehydrogenase assembly protein OpcA n=1 Tax=unclassified Streptomyces TaxID=2593676 RepID=UPI0020345F97|nr:MULTISPECIES: glucose-6-phosphate dehydrogenase assembly protein OpcA [unclassified Streptomyces]MCM2418711.1 glucose-6-phosphate dehydrogenase assembly protein OpcA [Streptomyces sp. RKAG293]MCM2429098.1 glucose-6-phosphate dehydrogenase assembly protein OpcA [Streptomyces sp. RKAG337]